MKEMFLTDYETVGAGQTTQVLGPNGRVGDILETLIVNVTTSASGTVSIKDGSDTAMALVPANTPIGVYSLKIGARSKVGAWQVTTGAGATVLAVGRFA